MYDIKPVLKQFQSDNEMKTVIYHHICQHIGTIHDSLIDLFDTGNFFCNVDIVSLKGTLATEEKSYNIHQFVSGGHLVQVMTHAFLWLLPLLAMLA